MSSKVHPHMLRHTFCTRLTEKNIPIERIAELAGHSKLDTTRIYAKVSLSKKHDAVKKLNRGGLLSRIFQKHKESKLKRSIPISKSITDSGFIPELRTDEIKRIRENIKLKISSCIISPEGYGKSSLLNYFCDQENVIFIDHIESKQDIYELMEKLFNNCFFSDYEELKQNRYQPPADLALLI